MTLYIFFKGESQLFKDFMNFFSLFNNVRDFIKLSYELITFRYNLLSFGVVDTSLSI